MARPIKETPILFGEDARRFEERMKEKRSETPEQREKGWKIMNWQWKSLKKIKYESFLYREALLAVSNVLENKTDCRFLTVDVYAAAVSFYDKNGFIPLNNEDVDSATRLLYFDLNDIMK